MAKIHKKVQSQQKVSQRYNLKELLGYAPNSKQKQMFYNLAVDKIVSRTADGRDINGRNFTPYSESYAEAKGVSRNSVDLILTGDMLSSFKENQAQPNMVEIKIEGGVNAKKAYNHDTGDTLPQREFFGFSNERDLQDIISQVDSAKDPRSDQNTQQGMDLAQLRDIIQSTITVEVSGFNSTEEGLLNAALLSELRSNSGSS